MLKPEYQSPPPSALRKFKDNYGKPLLTIGAQLFGFGAFIVNMIEAIIELPEPLRALISLNLAFLGLLCLFLIHLLNVTKAVRRDVTGYTGNFDSAIHAQKAHVDEEIRAHKKYCGQEILGMPLETTAFREQTSEAMNKIEEAATATRSEIGDVILQGVERLKLVVGQTNAISESISRLEAER